MTQQRLEAGGEVGERDLEIDAKLGYQVVGGDHGAHGLVEAARELVHPAARDRDAGGAAMPAEALEEVPAVADARVQIEAGDGASRALPSLAVERNEDRRPAEFLDDARGDDADDAGMPSLLGEDDAEGLVEVQCEHAL